MKITAKLKIKGGSPKALVSNLVEEYRKKRNINGDLDSNKNIDQEGNPRPKD